MIQKNWQELIKPNKLQYAPAGMPNSGKVVAEPLERGFGLALSSKQAGRQGGEFLSALSFITHCVARLPKTREPPPWIACSPCSLLRNPPSER